MNTFGSVWTSICSLFMAVSGGDDWGNQYNMLKDAEATSTAAVYLFFILFFTIAFWNIVTGQFMQETLRMASPDMDEIMLQKRKQDLCDLRSLMQFVGKVD